MELSPIPLRDELAQTLLNSRLRHAVKVAAMTQGVRLLDAHHPSGGHRRLSRRQVAVASPTPLPTSLIGITMQKLDTSSIRASFVNASRKEVSDLNLPELSSLDWD